MNAQVQQFLLVFIRMSVFIVVCPAFSMKAIPPVLKVALSGGLALAVLSSFPEGLELYPTFTFISLGIKEMMIGFAMGYVTLLYFTAVEMAGKFVDSQVGFSMGEMYDPNLGVTTSYYGRVYYWISICIFFLTNLHHALLRSLVLSYTWIPISQTSFTHFGTEGMVRLFGQIFGLAFQLAVPLIVVALLSEVVLALLSRTVPQINVLILGMPLKVLVSLIFFMLFLNPLIRNIGNMLPEMIQTMSQLLKSLSVP